MKTGTVQLQPPVETRSFRPHSYVRALRQAQLRGSMGPVGACADNAAMESFFPPTVPRSTVAPG